MPNDPPVLDLPEINIDDVPVLPPAPVHELPELDVPDVPTEEPKTPPTQEELPSASAEIKSQDEKVLPKTGSKDNIMYLVIGAFVGLIASLLLPLSKRK